MKKQTISAADKLFIACDFTNLIGESPVAVSHCGTALMFAPDFGGALLNYEEKRLTIEDFTWDEAIMDELLDFTSKHHFDLVLELPNGEYNIFKYAPKNEKI
jgi:hypothetical protein